MKTKRTKLSLITTFFLALLFIAGCDKEDPVIKVTGVTLNKSAVTLIEGDSENLSATVLPAEADNKKVSWQSDNTGIAAVDSQGKVTAFKAGSATITVTTDDGGKTATCKVTVEPKTIAVTGVALNKSSLTLTEEESETLTATVSPTDATNKKVSWKSDKTDIATVDSNGKVTAIAKGNSQIIATTEDGGKQAICNVVVPEPNIDVQFTKNGIYYRTLSPGSTDVGITNKTYSLDFVNFNWGQNSYSGDVNVPATVEYEGVVYQVKEVRYGAFWYSSGLKSVTLPEGLTYIRGYAFFECPNLQSVELPNTLKGMNNQVFKGCKELTALHIPKNVSSISSDCFTGCSNLELTISTENINFKVIDKVLFDANISICWIPEKKTGEYTIPEGTNIINSNATFQSRLSKITIPASVKTIWYFAGLIYSNITLHVPKGTKALYEAHALWGLGFNIVEQE